MNIRSDLVMFDGHGLIHPRRCGLATHASFFIDMPTIGVAKNPYKSIGTFEPPDQKAGSYNYIYDQPNRLIINKNVIIGAIVRTRTDTKPVYVSIGNFIALQTAIRIALECTDQNISKLPLPTYYADHEGRKIREQMRKNS